MKNIRITIFLALITSLTCQAQENKFDLGFNLFPNYSMGIITNDGGTPGEVESGYQGETWKPSMSANVFVEYKLNKNSIIGLGMGYQNNGERTQKIDLFLGTDPITGNPIIDPSLPTQAKFVYNHHNLEIPLYYRHLFGDRFFVLIGTSSIINIANTYASIKYFADESKERSTGEDNSTEFRRFNFSGNFGFGVDYLNTEKISLFVLPYVQYGVLGVSKSASLNRNFLSVGLSTGIRL